MIKWLKQRICEHKYSNPLSVPIYSENNELIIKVCQKCEHVETIKDEKTTM